MGRKRGRKRTKGTNTRKVKKAKKHVKQIQPGTTELLTGVCVKYVHDAVPLTDQKHYDALFEQCHQDKYKSPNPFNRGQPVKRASTMYTTKQHKHDYVYGKQISQCVGHFDCPNTPELVQKCVDRAREESIKLELDPNTLTAAVVNTYPEGSSGLSLHQDNEGCVDYQNQAIYGFSFGTRRFMNFSTSTSSTHTIAKVDLLPGSMLVMLPGQFQEKVYHGIPTTTSKSRQGSRISITVRAHKVPSKESNTQAAEETLDTKVTEEAPVNAPIKPPHRFKAHLKTTAIVIDETNKDMLCPKDTWLVEQHCIHCCICNRLIPPRADVHTKRLNSYGSLCGLPDCLND